MDMGPGLYVLRWLSYAVGLAGFVAALYMYEKVFLSILSYKGEYLNLNDFKDDIDTACWSFIGFITLVLFGVWCQLMGEHLAAGNIFLAIAICLMYLIIFGAVGCFISVWLRGFYERFVFSIWSWRHHRVEKEAKPEKVLTVQDIRQRAIIRDSINHPYFRDMRDFLKRSAINMCNLIYAACKGVRRGAAFLVHTVQKAMVKLYKATKKAAKKWIESLKNPDNNRKK